jgi:hypothetical protein
VKISVIHYLTLLSCGTLLVCSTLSGCDTGSCNDPEYFSPPVCIDHVGETSVPKLTLSGVCVLAPVHTEACQLAITAYEAGACTVELTYRDGAHYSKTLQFLAMSTNATCCGGPCPDTFDPPGPRSPGYPYGPVLEISPDGWQDASSLGT